MNSNTARKTPSLTEGPIVSSLLRFTLPFLFANLLQSLYGTIDTMILGQFGTTAGLSAVSTGAQILGTVTFFSIGLSSGGMVLLGQFIGAKRFKEAADVVGNLILTFSLISIGLMILTFFGYPAVLHLLNLPDAAVPEAHNYLRICCLGIPMIIGYNICCTILRSVGDSKSPLLFVGISCGVNILGDLVLTGYFRMGAVGVAIATVFAQFVSFLFALFFIRRKGIGFPFSKSNLVYRAHTVGRIFQIGIPMGLQSIMINMSFLFITSIINSMGLSASAAMGVGDKIENFAFMPQIAFMQSLAVVVAQNIGAGQHDRAVKAVRISTIISVTISLCFLTFCLIRPNVLPAIFTKDQVVIKMTGLYMMACGIDSVMTSISFCLSGLLNGAGKTNFNMIQNLISTFLGRVPATYALAHLANTNLFLIGLAAPAGTCLTLAMLSVYIGKGYWRKDL